MKHLARGIEPPQHGSLVSGSVSFAAVGAPRGRRQGGQAQQASARDHGSAPRSNQDQQACGLGGEGHRKHDQASRVANEPFDEPRSLLRCAEDGMDDADQEDGFIVVHRVASSRGRRTGNFDPWPSSPRLVSVFN
jgi:hypothetical protein